MPCYFGLRSDAVWLNLQGRQPACRTVVQGGASTPTPRPIGCWDLVAGGLAPTNPTAPPPKPMSTGRDLALFVGAVRRGLSYSPAISGVEVATVRIKRLHAFAGAAIV